MKTLRWTVRFLFLAGFSALVLLADNPARLHGILPACSPFLALLTLAAGGASLILLPSIVVVIISFIKPRFFCRWVCPSGTCFELAGSVVSRNPHPASLKLPRLGIWLLALGLGAALLGFPLFLALDPLAIFSSAFGWLHREPTLWGIAGAAVFPAMIILAAIFPWLWCGKLCPLGALQDIATSIGSAGASPSHASLLSRRADTGRRIFLGLGIGVLYRLLLNPSKLHAGNSAIRPPLSGSESRFTRLCARCGACIRACPEQIIRQAGDDCGFAGLLAPELDFLRGGCPPECVCCGEACPTGAIPVFTEQDKLKNPLGTAVLKKKLCVLSQNRECGICMNACPYQAIDIGWDPVEMTSVLKIDAHRCTGCGICQYVCPERPPAVVVAVR